MSDDRHKREQKLHHDPRKVRQPNQQNVEGTFEEIPLLDAAQRARHNPALLSPGAVLYLQRTIGNAAVQTLLTGSPSHPVTELTEASFAKKDDLVIQRKLDGTVNHNKQQKFRSGLVEGSYRAQTNVADVHIKAGDDDHGLTRNDMYKAVWEIHRVMKVRNDAGGPIGQVQMHPQGAVALKTVAELLGGALGGVLGKLKPKFLKRKRKKSKVKLTKDKESDVIDKVIIPEHMAFLRAIVGVKGVSIVPVLRDAKTLEEMEQNMDQNMLDKTEEGKKRMEAYETKLKDDKAVSMRVTISQTKLPKIIKLLKG
jgi:hypothetical protein